MSVSLSAYGGPVVVVGSETPGSVSAYDRSTDLELLAATAAPQTAKSLDHDVRPADSIALRLKFVVTGTPNSTDTIRVYGEDLEGISVDEVIYIDGGPDTYYTTMYWTTVDNIDISKEVGDWSVAVYQERLGVIEQYASGVLANYLHLVNITIGNGVDATTYSQGLGVQGWADGARPTCASNLDQYTLGTKSGEHAVKGGAVLIYGNDAFAPDQLSGDHFIYGWDIYVTSTCAGIFLGGAHHANADDCEFFDGCIRADSIGSFGVTHQGTKLRRVRHFNVWGTAYNNCDTDDHIIVTNCQNGVTLTFPTNETVIKDVSVKEFSGNDFRIVSGVPRLVYLRGCSYPASVYAFPSSSLYLDFEYQIVANVTPGARVEVYDQAEAKVVDEVVDGNGNFTSDVWLRLIRYTGSAGGGTSQSDGPFRVVVSLVDYRTHEETGVDFAGDISDGRRIIQLHCALQKALFRRSIGASIG